MDPYLLSQQKRKLIMISVLLVVLGIIAAVFSWFYNHAYLEISAQEDGSVTILDQASVKKSEHHISSDTPLKIFTKKGEKEVLFTSDNKTSLVITRVGSFLGTSKVKLDPRPENGRSFIGSNPDPCTQLVGNTLFSYDCSGDLNDIVVHQPATDKRASIVKRVTGAVDESLTIIGTMSDGIHLMAVSRVTDTDGDDENDNQYTYVVKFIDATGILVKEASLKQLSGSKQYIAAPYDDGLLLYNEQDFTAFRLFPDLRITSGIQKPDPDNKKLRLQSVIAAGSTVAAHYSSVQEDSREDEHTSTKATKGRSEVVLKSSSGTQHITFNEVFFKMFLCGENRLCGLNGNMLRVFDTSGKSTKYLYQISGVNSVLSQGSELFIERTDGLVSFDTKTRAGFLSYRPDGYRLCGSSLHGKNAVLCIINSRQDKMALLVDRQSTNNDAIDKKVNILLESSSIKSLSIHGTYIYITPEVGKLEYVPSQRQYGYNLERRATAAKAIAEQVVKAGINQQVYRVINTLP